MKRKINLFCLEIVIIMLLMIVLNGCGSPTTSRDELKTEILYSSENLDGRIVFNFKKVLTISDIWFKDTILNTGVCKGVWYMKSFLTFNLSQIKLISASRIKSATLKVYRYEIEGTPDQLGQIQIGVCDYGESLGDEDKDCETKDNKNLEMQNITGDVEVATWFLADFTEQVKEIIEKNNSNTTTLIQFMMTREKKTAPSSPNNIDYDYFYSSRINNEYKPQLVVEYYK